MTGVIIRKISELILVPLSGNKMSFVYCTPSSEDTWNGGQTRQCLGLPLDSSLLAQASSELPVTLPPATEPQQLPFFLHQVIPLLTLHVLPHPPQATQLHLCSEDRSQPSGRAPHSDEHWAELKEVGGVTTVTTSTLDSGTVEEACGFHSAGANVLGMLHSVYMVRDRNQDTQESNLPTEPQIFLFLPK